jgi:hypothetical protein
MEASNRVRTAGAACLLGGTLWTCVVGGFLAFSLATPGRPVAFYTFEVLALIIHILLLIGVLGLGWSGAAGSGWFGKLALGIALVGRMLFVLAEVHLLIIVSDSSPLLPLGALTTALGMLLTGVAVILAGRWHGWQRFAPLLAGLYPFLTMFPFLIITGQPSGVLIGMWGVCWALLGVALTRHTSIVHPMATPAPSI